MCPLWSCVLTQSSGFQLIIQFNHFISSVALLVSQPHTSIKQSNVTCGALNHIHSFIHLFIHLPYLLVPLLRVTHICHGVSDILSAVAVFSLWSSSSTKQWKYCNCCLILQNMVVFAVCIIIYIPFQIVHFDKVFAFTNSSWRKA